MPLISPIIKLRIWKFEKIEPLSFLELHADSKYMHVCPVLCAVIANFENTQIQFSPLIMFRRQYFFAFSFAKRRHIINSLKQAINHLSVIKFHSVMIKSKNRVCLKFRRLSSYAVANSKKSSRCISKNFMQIQNICMSALYYAPLLLTLKIWKFHFRHLSCFAVNIFSRFFAERRHKRNSTR